MIIFPNLDSRSYWEQAFLLKLTHQVRNVGAIHELPLREIKAGLVKFYFVLSAEEALAFLKSPEASSLVLILSDINMPGMNGLQLLKIIKTEYPHLKVFMNTAYGNDENKKIAMLYGADSYINKPLNFSELKEKIFQLIDNY